MKKILLIDDSSLFREYLANKLVENGFEVIEARNGLEGSLKLRNDMPDLIIMEYYLTRKSCVEILKEKVSNKNVVDVPVIMISTRIDREKILSVAQYNVKKFFSKPIKLDALLQTVSGFLQVELEIDNSPCIIEAHFNDEILFIEIALGLNTEKIELLKFKITELAQLYGVPTPKVLIMFSNIEMKPTDAGKLDLLFNTVLEQTGNRTRAVKVLATSDYLAEFIDSKSDFKGIDIKESLDLAMDDLLGLKPDQIAHDEVAAAKILSKSKPINDSQEAIELRFESERHGEESDERVYPEANIAVVDDDMIIQELVKTVLDDTGWNCSVFNNGKEFVDSLSSQSFDLVFLDLMMPEMNGFQVLQYMKQKKINIPTIVFSALTRKETVGKAMSFGVKSYIIKPLKPENLKSKAFEILISDF
ncbi:MAG: response regulator [Spirochaetales bacterium]|uniref:Response regulator n=1 Tax=Candidatus Thalassospirochaeta sargassi TaxID=3119039 RepID=A0AAJ1IFS4_9SPIO|nr:response regulator [Spirochaetales bacterium]